MEKRKGSGPIAAPSPDAPSVKIDQCRLPNYTLCAVAVQAPAGVHRRLPVGQGGGAPAARARGARAALRHQDRGLVARRDGAPKARPLPARGEEAETPGQAQEITAFSATDRHSRGRRPSRLSRRTPERGLYLLFIGVAGNLPVEACQNLPGFYLPRFRGVAFGGVLISRLEDQVAETAAGGCCFDFEMIEDKI